MAEVFTTAFTNLRRSPYQSLLAILMISITFFVGYVFSLTLMGAENVLKFFETRPQVIAFFNLDATDEVIYEAANKLRLQSSVKEVKLVTKQEALDLYKKDNRDNPLLLELVSADILPASIEVSAREASALPGIKEELSKMESINEVSFQEDLVNEVVKWTNSLRNIGFVALSLLGGTSLLMIFVIISMKTISKKQAIGIMKIIGATNWYIIAPFTIEGLLYGVIGSIIGWVGMYSVFLYVTPWIKDFLGTVITLPVPFAIFGWQLLIGTCIGAVFGSLVSLIASSRMLQR